MVTQFGIHIKVKDINRSLEFYRAFHLKPDFAYGDNTFRTKFREIQTAPEKYRGVIFNISGALLEIAEGHIAVKPKVFCETIKSSKISAMLHVKSVKTIVNICKERGFKIAAQPRVFPWGTKEVVVKDPDGFILVFIEKLSKN
ncbi:hypothetical protein A2W49_01430 [Candidatus Roizmanbacteria bacterium RIFCSPHIGHO2_12_41_18]|nr:MAG: hypothetical protein A2W49_01430 [Candidatus Roizmanbacteria bacterium RIFCSPHIGHO2_12_41_18]OGK59176.1 MAG: hypothetical protein A3H84_02925 [Candidatus Roizmanbacteria bacterium RIFCSPLOWO2_02_FULL_40_13]